MLAKLDLESRRRKFRRITAAPEKGKQNWQKKSSTQGLHTCLLTFLLYRFYPSISRFTFCVGRAVINQDNFDIAFGQKERPDNL
jgi:hypothetical protein